MRIAIIADIHGNLPAFEATLEHIQHQHVDRVVIAGDVVNGSPDSAACWDLACSLGCPILRGNHERYVALYATPEGDPAWLDEQFAPVQWSAGQFSATQRRALWDLPATLHYADLPDVLIVHGSLRDDRDAVWAATPNHELAAMFPDVAERIIVRAHQHNPAVRLWGRHQIVTVGSVGLALGAHPEAQYLILEQHPTGWEIQHQSVPYEVHAALQRFHASGYLEMAGPMARLYMREVATASYQIVPFLRWFRHWKAQAPITLAQAVDRYINI